MIDINSITPQEKDYLTKLKSAGYDSNSAFSSLERQRAKSLPDTASVEEANGIRIAQPDKGVGQIVKEKVVSQVKGVGEAVGRKAEEFKEKSSFEQLTAPTVGAFKLAGGLVKELAKRGYDVAEETVKTVATLPEFGRATTALIMGEEPNPSDMAEIERVGKGQREAVEGVAEFMPVPMVQAAVGLEKTSREALEEGALPKEALVEGAVSGVERWGFMKALNKLFKPKATKPKEVGKLEIKPKVTEKLRLKDPEISAAMKQAKINPAEGKKILQVADDAAKSNAAIKPMEYVGGKFSSFRSSLSKQVDDIGKQIGTKAQKLGGTKGTLDLKASYKAMEKSLHSKGITIKDRVLDFTKSDLKYLPESSKKLLQKQYTLLRKGMSPREVLANNRALGNELYRGSTEKAFSGAEGILNEVRQFSVKAINKQYPALAKLNTQYSELVGVLDDITHAMGKEGLKAPQILRRLFGNASGVPRDVIRQAQALARKYNIETGKNLFTEADFALAAETAAGVKAPTGFAVRDLTRAGIAERAIQGVGDKFIGDASTKLLQIINRASPEAQKKLMDKLIKSVANSAQKKDVLIKMLEGAAKGEIISETTNEQVQ